MRLNGIVEINETEKLNVPIGAVFKVNLAVPHVHQGADNPLSFTIGLRTIDAGKLLTDTVLPANFDESVGVSLSIGIENFPVIGVEKFPPCLVG